MSFVAVAVIGVGALAGAGASIYSANESASASEEASQLAANATNTAAGLQYKLGEEGLDMQRPFYEAAYPLLPYETQAGLQAYQQTLPQMQSIATNYQTSPLTQNELTGTTGSINNALSARGLYNSGAGVQAISSASQNIMANQEQNQWNRLAQLYQTQVGQTVSTGANAASGSAQTASNLGSGLANTYLGGAAMQTQALEFGSQSQANMYSNIGGMGMGLATGYLKNQSMNNYLQGLQNTGYDPSTSAPTASLYQSQYWE
jgi:hypothetical protein